MAYVLALHKSAKKDLKKLPKHIRSKVLDIIENKIHENPKASGDLLKGHTNVYKYRLGSYRIIWHVDEEILTILILDCKPRGDVYKKY